MKKNSFSFNPQSKDNDTHSIVRNKILSLTDEDTINVIVERTKENIKRREEKLENDRYCDLGPILRCYTKISDRINRCLLLEEKRRFVVSSVSERLLEILKILRQDLFYRVRCDACNKGVIHAYSLSSNFYCESCFSYIKANSSLIKSTQFKLIDMNERQRKEDNEKFNTSSFSLLKKKLSIIKTEVDSSSKKDKESLFFILERVEKYMNIVKKKLMKFSLEPSF